MLFICADTIKIGHPACAEEKNTRTRQERLSETASREALDSLSLQRMPPRKNARADSEASIEATVLALISRWIEPDPVQMTSSLIWDLNFDSMNCLDLGLRIEAEFGVSMGDDIRNKWSTVGDVVSSVMAAQKL